MPSAGVCHCPFTVMPLSGLKPRCLWCPRSRTGWRPLGAVPRGGGGGGQPAQPPIHQLLGAADAQTAHHIHIQHSPITPTTGLRERGNDTSRSTGRSGRQNAATRRNMRSEERVTVQGPVKKQQPDGMSHGGGASVGLPKGISLCTFPHAPSPLTHSPAACLAVGEHRQCVPHAAVGGQASCAEVCHRQSARGRRRRRCTCNGA